MKHALAVEYEVFGESKLTRLSTELALPIVNEADRRANFLKFELRHTHSWQLIPGKVNLVCDL